jgi:hypothetical protein
VCTALLGVGWFSILQAASAPTATPGENQIKATALYNVIAFTEWPAKSFASDETPLVIGVLGEGPIATLLRELVANETWRGRPVVVRKVANAADAKSCHVVFIARSEDSRWRTLSAQFTGAPILTVADAENFARHGGIVQFGFEGNKLKLIVNLGAARRAGLVISSKVLRMAQIIDERSP